MKLDPKHIAYAVGVLGILGGAAGGYLRITTPEAAACEVALADRSARLELTDKAMQACSDALTLCAGGAR